MDIVKHITGLQHIGLPTADIEVTAAFYRSLGFEETLRTLNSRGAPLCFLQLKNICIEAYQTADAPGTAGAIDHIAIDVSDVEAVYKALKQGGYVMLDQEIRFMPFWENGVRFFNIQGPNKEKIEFSQVL